MTYPRIKTLYGHPGVTPSYHPVVEVVYAEKDSPKLFCGDTWCNGTCGFPALVLNQAGRELKMRSSMVAMGRLMQEWRFADGAAGWKGARVELPEQHRETFLDRWWN
jgi:hypothetical protein